MADILSGIVGSAQSAFGAGINDLGAFASYLGSVPGGVATSIHDAAVKLWSTPGDAYAANMSSVASSTKKGTEDITTGIKEGLTNTGAGVQGALANVGAGVQSALTSAGTGEQSALTSLGTGLKNAGQGAGAGVQGALTGGANGLNSFIPIILIGALLIGAAFVATKAR